MAKTGSKTNPNLKKTQTNRQLQEKNSDSGIVHISARITVNNCRTQYITKQFSFTPDNRPAQMLSAGGRGQPTNTMLKLRSMQM